jgi:hypothetical protein
MSASAHLVFPPPVGRTHTTRSSYEHGHFDPEHGSEVFERIFDLEGEFTRGEYYQSAAAVLGKPLKHRETEREGFTCSCLRDADDIFALNSDGNRLMLNRRGRGELFLVQDLQEVLMDSKVMKSVARGLYGFVHG